MASSAKSEKTMSSRLLTMKFMQRAAASAPSSAPNSTENTPDRPTKRQRTSGGVSSYRPSDSSDLAAVRAALAAEDLKRTQALDRQATEAGETKWVLSFQDPTAGKHSAQSGSLNIVTGGFADIDDSGDEPVGRLNFGKRKTGAAAEPDSSDSSDEDEDGEDEDEEDESDENDPAASLLKEERRKMTDEARLKLRERKRKREKKLAELGDARRKKEVKLNNNPTSISGNGSRGGQDRRPATQNRGGFGQSNRSDIDCNYCHEKGHMIKDCPNKSRRQNQGWKGGLKMNN